jgi:tetratricopeptide (TPR) repeat protein
MDPTTPVLLVMLLPSVRLKRVLHVLVLLSKEISLILFFELLKKEDYEGALNLEPDVVRQAKGLEGTEPEMASMIYQAIATAHLEIGSPSRKMAPEKAIRYLERSFGLLEKINDTQEGIHSCVLLLVSVHLQEGRYNEAVGTVKRLTFSMPHEIIYPDLILRIAHTFFEACQFERVIGILTMVLGAVNRSWGEDHQALAYTHFGEAYTQLVDYEKAKLFLHKAISIVEDRNTKVRAMCRLGMMYKVSCDHDKALAALRQALDVLYDESGMETSWSQLAVIHVRIGQVLSDGGKRDLEALQKFNCALDVIKEHDIEIGAYLRAVMYHGLGLVHARLGNWDDAIEDLNLALGEPTTLHPALCSSIVKVLLDQYCSDERLLHNAQEREKILKEVGISTTESIMSRKTILLDDIVNYAQQKYFLGEIKEANELLMMYFGEEMDKKQDKEGFCRWFQRKAGKDTEIKKCTNCKGVDYCSEAHLTRAWRRGRLSHKVMCPFLRRWRRVANAENSIETESFENICKDFFETVCVRKYEVEALDNGTENRTEEVVAGNYVEKIE